MKERPPGMNDLGIGGHRGRTKAVPAGTESRSAGARERGSAGTRERGSAGARERESAGARERGSAPTPLRSNIGANIALFVGRMNALEISELLRRRIMADVHLGRLKPGDRLPSL